MTGKPLVCLMGASLSTGNRGVSALGASLVKLVSQVRPDLDVNLLLGQSHSRPASVMVGGQPRTVSVINFRLSPKARISEQLGVIVFCSILYRLLPLKSVRNAIVRRNPFIAAVRTAVMVGDIRGGDSFSDIYGLRRFFLGSLPVLSVLLVRGNIVHFPQTFGPFKTRTARWIARYILNRSTPILCRDRLSLDQIAELTQGRSQGTFCPDVAFALEPVLPDNPAIDPVLPSPLDGPLVGLNVNGLMFNGGYTRSNMFGLQLDYGEFLVRLVMALTADPDVRILLVPHTFAPDDSVESDPGASRALLRRLPQDLRCRVHLVTEEYDQHHIKGVIGMCDYFIGSRMHSCIAALSQGIPTAAVAYSRKFVGLFDSIGLGAWVIDGATTNAETAVERVKDLFQRRKSLRLVLASGVEEARGQLVRTFQELLQGDESCPASPARARPSAPLVSGPLVQ